MGTVTRTTRLAATGEDVWAFALTPEGINDELRPWLRMTVPSGLRGVGIDGIRVNEPLGKSWVLLLGIVPFDYDAIQIAELGPGHRFLERSTMASMRVWQHEREIADIEGGCSVTDTLTFELRKPLALIPGVARMSVAFVGRIFNHRHQRLARRWGRL